MGKLKGGLPSVLEILQLLDSEARERLLANLAAKDARLADQLKERLFTFEDIASLDDSSTQSLLREAPRDVLLIGLRNASADLKAHLLKNMTSRAATQLKDDLDAQTPKRLSEVKAAQAKLIELAQRLESEGKLLLKKK